MEPIKFDEDTTKLLSGPGVYLYRHKKTVVYVGASAFGLGRTFGHDHRMRRFDGPLSVEFIPCETSNEAFDLEVKLILEHCPTYNSKNTGGKGVELPTPEQRAKLEVLARMCAV